MRIYVCQKIPERCFHLFDLTPDDAVELWAVVKPVVEKFHGNAENYYSNFYGLLQENLPPRKFGGDIALTYVLLSEVGNHILMHLSLSTQKVHYDNPTIKHDSVKLSEREFKSLRYDIGYVVHKLYSKFKFCYSIESQVNRELSLNLLESMLESFVKVRTFSFARDIKEKHKVKNKKTKAPSLRTEVKKFPSSKDFNH